MYSVDDIGYDDELKGIDMDWYGSSITKSEYIKAKKTRESKRDNKKWINNPIQRIIISGYIKSK